MKNRENPMGFKEILDFGLIEALLGRRCGATGSHTQCVPLG